MSPICSSLRERWREEAEFHDVMVEHDTRWTAFRAFGLSEASIQYAKDLVGDVRGKILVDIGCGDGSRTGPFVQAGATILACDISYGMAQLASSRLQDMSKAMGCITSCQQMAAEEMGYASSSIDIIFGLSVLHHLEILLAIQEIKRVLKPGGRAIFVEPLNHNPMANLYRTLTPNRHSAKECPLDYSIFNTLEEHFYKVRHREFYLLSLGIVIFSFLKSKRMFDWSLSTLLKVDEKLFSLAPWLRKFAWITVIEIIN
jgi:ubiquinone/menaquinone biosynthesis C-methylase UbiE